MENQTDQKNNMVKVSISLQQESSLTDKDLFLLRKATYYWMKTLCDITDRKYPPYPLWWPDEFEEEPEDEEWEYVPKQKVNVKDEILIDRVNLMRQFERVTEESMISRFDSRIVEMAFQKLIGRTNRMIGGYERCHFFVEEIPANGILLYRIIF